MWIVSPKPWSAWRRIVRPSGGSPRPRGWGEARRLRLPLIFFPPAAKLSEHEQGAGEIPMRVAIGGVQCEHVLEHRHRFTRTPGLGQGDARVRLRLGIIRPKSDRLAVRDDRFVVAIQCSQRFAKVVMKR